MNVTIETMEIPREFWDAADDLRYLLNRGYPREGSLQAVGNRYNLPQDLRHLLRRGVFPTSVAEARKQKMVTVEAIRGEKLAIDGYNIIITLESALRGRPIVLADDGFCRDIAGVSASYRSGATTVEALDLIFTLLGTAGPAEVIFLFDSPISGSGELAARIRALMKEKRIQGDASAVKVPERVMEGHRGIIASSDTVIINQAAMVFDLAGHLIKERLKTPFLDMEMKR